jgi:hypothetical protein
MATDQFYDDISNVLPVMFRGKLNRSNSRLLLTILERLRNGERDVFTVNTLFNSDVVLHESCVRLELFIYRVIGNNIIVDMENAYTHYVQE